MSGERVLEVELLSAGYGSVRVLHDVSLALRRGEIATIIGPNGAGKTTLLASIMGLLPASGRVSLLGRDAARRSVEQRVAAGLVLVPERRELFADMTVADNLLLGAFSRARRDRARLRQDLAQVHAMFPRLAERQAQLAGSLSGGERQMLALGRALMAKPTVLLLDEPSLGLAPRIVQEILGAIVGLARRGMSILLVEQNARAALAASSYGYVLEMGRVAIEGESARLAEDARVVSAYLGRRIEPA